jgi:predicted secreted protein
MRKIVFISILGILSLQSCKIVQNCKVDETYKVDETFEVELEKEGIGGYQWNYIAIPEVDLIKSTSIVSLVEDELERYNKRFTLKGIKSGKYKLEFHYLRSFEKIDAVPKEHIRIIKIRIKKTKS